MRLFGKKKTLVARLDDFDDGFDHGWDAAIVESVQYLRDQGFGLIANELKGEFLNGE